MQMTLAYCEVHVHVCMYVRMYTHVLPHWLVSNLCVGYTVRVVTVATVATELLLLLSDI